MEAWEIGRFREPVEARRSVEFVCLEDADSCWDGVLREIGDKQYVPVHEVVCRNEGFEVGTWNDRHLPARAIEVGGDRVLVAYFGLRKVDIPKRGGASGWGDAEDDVVGGRGSTGWWVVLDGVAKAG